MHSILHWWATTERDITFIWCIARFSTWSKPQCKVHESKRRPLSGVTRKTPFVRLGSESRLNVYSKPFNIFRDNSHQALISQAIANVESERRRKHLLRTSSRMVYVNLFGFLGLEYTAFNADTRMHHAEPHHWSFHDSYPPFVQLSILFSVYFLHL